MRSIHRKVCLLGDMAVGKTSLIQRFVYNRFDERYLATIGVTVSRKTVVVPRPECTTELTLIVWDLAGGDDWTCIRASYLRGAAGAILVCDLSRPATVDAVMEHAAELRRASPAAQLVVAANKEDLVAPGREAGGLDRLADRLGAPVFATSAKTGRGVEKLFRGLAEALVVRAEGDVAWTP